MKNNETSPNSFFIKSLEDDEIAFKQWIAIEATEKMFSEVRVPKSKNLFKEDSWIDQRLGRNIHHSQENPARVLLHKFIALHRLSINKIKFSSALGELSCVRAIFDEAFGSSILAGGRGEKLIGLNEVSESQFLANLDMILITRSHPDKYFLGIEKIVEVHRRYLNRIPLYNLQFDLPWKSNGITKWISERRQVLEIGVPESFPYSAMPVETFGPLIEKSMSIIEKKSAFVINVHQEILELSKALIKDNVSTSYLNISHYFHESKGLEEFLKLNSNDLEGLPEISHFTTVRSWWLAVMNHIRAACLNVLLFTTGLRNVDICGLRMGCYEPSGLAEMLYYVKADIEKTNNSVFVPVPAQTIKAIQILEMLRTSNSPYVFSNHRNLSQGDYVSRSQSLNRLVSNFAAFYNIPFSYYKKDKVEYTAHCYRSTVAGWLDSMSNISILLVKRLFGHSNQLMPLAYLQHNPIFIKQRRDALRAAALTMATSMAKAAKAGKVGGKRGDALMKGFDKLRSSSSLSEFDIFKTVHEQLEERISTGQMFAMATHFGVICTRSPNDSSQSPCRKISDREKFKSSEIDKEIWNHLQSTPNPAQCIGKLCDHAMLGPWSESLRDSYIWFQSYLEKSSNTTLSSAQITTQAKAFIKLYAPEMQKIFGIKTN